MYDSINAAARGLLGEATAIVEECGHEFAVCGGWSPLLRNSSRISHPGTRDVDLLFSKGATKQALAEVVLAFLDRGYLVSAKHEFQVLRVLPVGGTRFVFNVDLLHPHEGVLKGDLCVDHLSLPVPYEDYESSSTVFLKSIALPNAGFVFDGFIAKEPLKFVMPDGASVEREIPLIDEVGVIVTKSKSCTIRKRPRDIFDIYLAISSPRDEGNFKLQLDRLRANHEAVFASMECIGQGIGKWIGEFGHPSVFEERGIDFVKAAQEIRKFLNALNFPALA